MTGAMGPKEYGVLLTDRRTIFVLERVSKAALVGVIGDALITDKKSVDYSGDDLEKLASDEKNITIQHHDIERIKMKKSLTSYTLVIEHKGVARKRKNVKAYLVPPQELVNEKTKSGMKKKQVIEEYAKSVKRAFEAALPPMVAEEGEWDA
jgi:TPP-dependent 2-oxoacid decarboxylase